MAWAWWLAVPVVTTVVAAVGTWWSGHARRRRRPGTDAAMRAHRDYLAALVEPARGTERVGR